MSSELFLMVRIVLSCLRNERMIDREKERFSVSCLQILPSLKVILMILLRQMVAV